jgi:hypothetical protein
MTVLGPQATVLLVKGQPCFQKRRQSVVIVVLRQVVRQTCMQSDDLSGFIQRSFLASARYALERPFDTLLKVFGDVAMIIPMASLCY